MNKLISIVTALAISTLSLADDDKQPDKKPKSTKQEEKYLNLVDAAKAFEIAKETKKRVLVYQDWPS